ncbi:MULTISPECIES: DUF6993 domain-containing protein [Micrococcaceae]|uniref:DUF6993 domain-containing protein n=1 Tax=unclassified Kocuria TaxID=2649579 RepID=UPI0010108E80|nr:MULTISPECIES: hypothetical protein [unclassified Kocuria]
MGKGQRSSRRQWPIVLVAFGLVGGISGCSTAGAEPQTPVGEVSGATSSDDQVQVDAAKIKEAVEAALSDGDVTEARVREAIIQSGRSGDDVETGQDSTPTGLNVDNVDAAVKTHEQCVMVDVRADRTVTAVGAPALSTGRCMIGHAYTG